MKRLIYCPLRPKMVVGKLILSTYKGVYIKVYLDYKNLDITIPRSQWVKMLELEWVDTHPDIELQIKDFIEDCLDRFESSH